MTGLDIKWFISFLIYQSDLEANVKGKCTLVSKYNLRIRQQQKVETLAIESASENEDFQPQPSTSKGLQRSNKTGTRENRSNFEEQVQTPSDIESDTTDEEIYRNESETDNFEGKHLHLNIYINS